MYPNERFVTTHFRSYLISKFNYAQVGELVSVQGCKVVTLIQPGHYDYAAPAWFFVSSLWPASFRFKRNVRGSRDGNILVGLSTRYTKQDWEDFGWGFTFKCAAYYFVLLDGTDPRWETMGLVVSFGDNISTYCVPYLMEVFPELDFMLGKSYGLLRSITKSWTIHFTWVTQGARTRIEHITPVRALGYPAHFK